MELIVDDAANVKKVFEEMKHNLKSNIPQALESRELALKKLIEGYEKYLPQIDAALKKDVGFNSFMSNFGAHAISLGEIKDLLNNVREWSKPRSIKTPLALGLAESKVQYQPLGLVLVISAWNYPIYTALPQVAAAICAGNSVILKPSELSPYTSNVLKKLFDEFMDPRFYRVIEGKVEVGKALTQLPFNMICFTGSTQTGRLVAIEAAKNLTPCILELGGKCPVIVDQSANLYSAALRIIFGKYINCGQTCVGVDHVYVHESVREKFKTLLLEEVKKAFQNQNLIEDGNYGKINNLGHLNRLEKFYKENHGGKTLYGGQINKEKLFFSPTIVEGPSKDSLLMKQEIFGPILPLHSYTNLHDLVTQIRNKPRPLAFYMFSEKDKDIEYVKNHTSSGAFVVNDSVVQLLNSHLPFGGVGESGYGRYHGEAGFMSFSNPKSIVYTQAFNGYPMSSRFAPYTESKQRAMTFLLKIGGVTYTQLKKWSIFFGLVAVGAVAALKIKPHL